jgi:hypothetical protein
LYANFHRRQFVQSLAIAAMNVPLLFSGAPCHAQVTRGFDQVVEAYTTGEERNRQKDLWVLEVQMKPVRLLTVPITDPATGEQHNEQIWYLAYRAANRSIGTQQDDSDTAPVNALDKVLEPPKFIPEFTLMVYDNPADQISDQDQIYVDAILPEAVAAINRVEAHRPTDPLLKDSVSVVQEVPPATAAGDAGEQWVYGVATWRGVDPDTDYFKVILSGFSNGYQIVPGANGENEFWRKVLVQEFTRLGDRFDPNLKEFKFAGPAEWTYRPESAQPAATAP